MKKNYLILFASVFSAIIFLVCSYGVSVSQDDEEKVKPDAKLFEEFKNCCEKCSTDITYKGVSTYLINGATITARFTTESKDLENCVMNFAVLNDPYTITVTPGNVSIHGKNRTDDRTDKRSMVKYSLKALLDELYDNGRITKKTRDGKNVYYITLFNLEQNHEYCVDPATGYFESSSAKSSSNANPVVDRFDGNYEAKYTAWIKK